MNPDYAGVWRARLDESSRLFGAIYQLDPSISLPYGVVAGALLWPIRDDHERSPASDLLAEIVGAAGVGRVHDAIAVMQASGPLAGARHLSRLGLGSLGLASELERLLDHFRDDWLRLGLLRPASVSHIAGSVEGANVVINGVQYVGGDLVVTVIRPRTRTCPTAPDPPKHFAGRRSELARLKAMLEHGGNVAITGVHGMGGIGKTALAQQLTTELDGFGAVLWASLGPAPSVVNHLVNWARHDDPRFEAGDSPVDVLAERVNASLTALVREHCHGRALVILDDVWEGASVAAARTLQRAAPRGAAYLITTRSQLVVAQLRSTGLDLRPLEPADALEMLRNLLPDREGIAGEHLLALAEVTGHHPLALELAAGQVKLLERPASEITALIDSCRGGIPAGSPFRDIRLELGEAREDNLELVLSFSYERLPEADQARYRALGALAPGAAFDRSLCRALWAVEEARPPLDTLRHAGLLTTAPAAGWYEQHPLLRAYGRALLVRDPLERAAVDERYAEQVAGLAERFGVLPRDAWEPLEPYVPHVEEAGRHVVEVARRELERPEPDERALARGLAFALGTRHLLASRRELRHPEWLELGLAVSRRRLDVGHANTFLGELGQDNILRGDVKAGMARLNEAAEAARHSGDRAGLARAQLLIGEAVVRSDPDVAPQYLRDAAEQFERLGDTAGQVAALLRLAEWSALPFHDLSRREDGLAIVLRARDVATAADSVAEVELCIGRLYDLLGRRDEALESLSAAVERFKTLRILHREGIARLLLASAHANRGGFDDAERLLVEALPLLRSTGDAPGQATALRNLAELELWRGRPGPALERFADALPLVRRQTMRLVNEDDTESSIAVPVFSAQLDDVRLLEQVEHSRAQIQLDQPLHGVMPDELLRHLATETAWSGTGENGRRMAWARALGGFVARLADLGEPYAAERRFVDDLLALTLNQPAAYAASGHYGQLIDQIRARIEHRRARPDPLFSDDQVRFYTHGTLAARLGTPAERHDWARRLRRDRRLANELGDRLEVALLDALLAVLGGRVIALRDENPYLRHFLDLGEQLRAHERPPGAVLVEGTVAVRTVIPERRDAWIQTLLEARYTALLHGDWDAHAFVDGLLRLTDGAPAELPAGNPHARSLAFAAQAIAERTPLEVPIPPAHLEACKSAVLAVHTRTPKSADTLSHSLAVQGAATQAIGRYDEPQLYAALVRLLSGEPPRIPPGSRYEGVLREIVDAMRRQPVAAARDDSLPEQQVDELVAMVSGALTGEPEKATAVRDFVARFGARCRGRGRAWKRERAFADTLLALLDGRSPSLRACGEYQAAIGRVTEAIDGFREIRSRGGNLTPAKLSWLLGETERAIRIPREIMEEQLDSPQGLMAMYQDSRVSDAFVERANWTARLADLRGEFAKGGPRWRHEVALVEALLTAVDSGDPRLPADNPYLQPFEVMLKASGHWPGLRSQDLFVEGMGLKREAFQEHFRGVVIGQTQFARQLDGLLANVVGAMTFEPHNVEKLVDALAHSRAAKEQRLSGNFGSIEDVELLRALEAVLRGEAAALPEGHAYAAHLRSALHSIGLFHAPPAPGKLSPEWLSRICIVTPGVLTIGTEHLDAFRAEMLDMRDEMARMGPAGADAEALFAAILIVLEDRPADLPFENPYRLYLQLAQLQLQALRRPHPASA